MNILSELRQRFARSLARYVSDPASLVEMVRPSQDPRFGDYQANFAMPLGKQLGRPPRELAAEIAAATALDDLCSGVDVEGPGFINLKLADRQLSQALAECVRDSRLGVPLAETPRMVIVDYSSPNVAKPLHVGHIRSTVIGYALVEMLRFQGHRVLSDNHIGDWGTQFGMILYGYKHLVDAEAFRTRPMAELGRLYRLVSSLVSYFTDRDDLPQLEQKLATAEAALAAHASTLAAAPAAEQKKLAKEERRLQARRDELRAELAARRQSLAAREQDPVLGPLLQAHPDIAQQVLAETAKLHAGDAENRRLWEKFLPLCLADIERIYQRLGVSFDMTLGESYYEEQLATVVEELRQRGLAKESAGAVCIFFPGHETPMIVQKQDGAFLYATTDLATIRHRMRQWQPDTILYVVDHRQSLHFEQLFEAARLWGYDQVQLKHVSFGTILGDDGRPFRTRSGDTVGLESLLDEAVERARAVITEQDEAKPAGRALSEAQQAAVAEVVGIGALKYADLSQNRTSDYVFSYDKMLATKGNTATYMQYAYARVRSIFAKGEVDIEALRASGAAILLGTAAERNLALSLLRFPEALEMALADYYPHHLTGYLFELANHYSSFFDACPVLKAETAELRASRLLLCDLTARTIRQGLELLGIGVSEQM